MGLVGDGTHDDAHQQAALIEDEYEGGDPGQQLALFAVVSHLLGPAAEGLRATIIHHFNPIDGLIGSFTGYLVPSIADSWNAGMLIIMALIGALDALVTLSGLLYVLLYLFGLAFAFYPLTRWCKQNEGFSWPWPHVQSEKKRIKKLRRQQEAEKAEREEK
jgi:hypothetical protein